MIRAFLGIFIFAILPIQVLGDQNGGGSAPDPEQLCLDNLSAGFSQLNPQSPEGLTRHFYMLSKQVENGNNWLEAHLKTLSVESEGAAGTCDKIHRAKMARASIDARKVLLSYADFYASGFHLENLEHLLEIENLPEKIGCLTDQLVRYGSVRVDMEKECSVSKEENSTIFSTFMSDKLEPYVRRCSYPMSASLKSEVIKIQERRIREAKEHYEIYRAEQKYFFSRFPNLTSMFDEQHEKYSPVSQVGLNCEDPKQALFNQIKLSTKKLHGASRGTFRVASGSGFLTRGSGEGDILLVTAFHSVNPKNNQKDLTRTTMVFDLINETDRLEVEVKPHSPSAQNDIVTIKVESPRAPLLSIIESGRRPELNQIFYVAGYPDTNENEYSVFECFFVGYENKIPFHLDIGTVKKYKMFCPTRVNLEGVSGGPVFDENGVVWGVDSAQDFIEGSILVSPISRNLHGKLVFGLQTF